MYLSVVDRHSVVLYWSKNIEIADNNKKIFCFLQSSVVLRPLQHAILSFGQWKRRRNICYLRVSIEPSLGCLVYFLHPALVLLSAAHQHTCSGFKEAILSSSEGRLHLVLYAFFPFQFIISFLLSSLSRDEKPMSDRWMPFLPLIIFENSLS